MGEAAVEDIAVVGMAGRFPGAPDVATFWRNLLAGVDAIRDYDDAGLIEAGVDPALRADPRFIPSGGYLPGVCGFDAGFFGFTAAEAAGTDPQHRLFLETAWTALEDAGHDPARSPATVGVFTGCGTNRRFLSELVRGKDPDDWTAALVPGGQPDYLPAQVAYRLDLTGPALAVQTACSSSLVAVCVAAQHLLDLRCDLALAGGVSVTWPRYRYTAGGLASPDGRCRAFDATARGAGFGSGVGVVALKRLTDAVLDGDRVYAVLRGWSVNNDGAARAGFATPGLDGQAAVAVEALAGAGVTAGEVGFVEAHGSGTPLGDVIEVAALTRAFEAVGGTAPGSVALGTVKSNVGHLDAAAGVTGFIKAVLAVHYGQIPASLHYTTPNPDIDFAATPFFVPTRAVDWAGPRVATVGAFGLGGTNAHAVLAQPPPVPAGSAPRAGHLLTLSAAEPAALHDTVRRLRRYLVGEPAPDLSDVAYTLARRRRHFPHRAAVLCADRAEALAALDAAIPGGRCGSAGTDPELAAVADRFLAGGEPAAAYPDRSGRVVGLPGYPFQRRRYWLSDRDGAP